MGYKLYFVSINPVSDDYRLDNQDLDAANARLKKGCKNYYWVDTSNYLKETGFNTNDGLHYDKETSLKIYDRIVSEVD